MKRFVFVFAIGGCTVFENTDKTTIAFSEAVSVCGRAQQCGLIDDAVIASLGIPLHSNNASLCVDTLVSSPTARLDGTATQMLRCIAAAGDCNTALRCTSDTPISPADPICDAGSRCINTSAYDCVNHSVARCGVGRYQQAPSCTTISDASFVFCVAPTCAPTGDRCEGPSVVRCGPKGARIDDCSARMLDCSANQCGTQGCSRGMRGATSCANEKVLQICDGADIISIDCTTRGMCKTGAGGARCASMNEQCDAFEPATCEGKALVLCIGGKKRRFECANGCSGQRCL